MKPQSDRVAARFGRWRYDYAAKAWDISPELLELADIGSADTRDVAVFFAAMPDREERERLRRLMDRAIDERGSMAAQVRLSTLGRGDIVMALVADTVRDAAGEPVELRGFSTDVTEEVRVATRAAVDAATRHRRAIEQVKGALMVTYRIDEVTAFALLRQQSNVHNVKLNVLSEHVSRSMAAPGDDDARVPLIELVERVARDLATPDGQPPTVVADPPA